MRSPLRYWFGVPVLVVALLAPVSLFTNSYNRGLLVLIAIYAVGGLSLDYIMGEMGQFSFGHAAFWGFGAYVSAKLALDLGISPWFGFVAAPVAAGLVGLLIGYIALRRTRGLELAIVTLGFGVLAWTVALRWRPVTGGPSGLRQIPPPSLFGWEIRSEMAYYYFALILLLGVVFILSRMREARFGRAVRSIHENEDLAKSIGVSATKYYVLAFSFACAMVGFSGALYAHHFRFVNPNLLGLQYMFIFLIVVLVGGTGTLWGPVMGSVIFVLVSEWLRALQEYRFLIFGVVLLLVVLFMPSGVYPALQKASGRLRERSDSKGQVFSGGQKHESGGAKGG
ncbi:MAG: branched-chain amino acid ABC transporter permease [bacterium]|nr:branched-chain amino acid ABC transporter permease [Acidimicrobiia bacterium]MCY4648996.1 branched-chain amino acid ABC transporter permease [bacterium]